MDLFISAVAASLSIEVDAKDACFWDTFREQIISKIVELVQEAERLKSQNEILHIEANDKVECAENEVKRMAEENCRMRETISTQENQIRLNNQVLDSRIAEEIKKSLFVQQKLQYELQELRQENLKEKENFAKQKSEIYVQTTEMEIMKSKISYLEMQLANALKEVDKWKQENENSKKEHEELQSEYSSYRNVKSKELIELSKQNEIKNEEASQLKFAVELRRKRIEELESKEEECEKRKETLQKEIIEQSDKFRQEIESKDKLIMALKKSVEESLVKLNNLQMIDEERDLKHELEMEKAETYRLRSCLEELCAEVEDKFNLFSVEKVKNEKLFKENMDLVKSLDNLKTEVLVKEKGLATLESEKRQLAKENGDLAKQVQLLIAEIEGGDSIGLIEGNSYENGLIINADQVISDRLLKFKNIQELQQKNQELLRIIRCFSQEKEEELDSQKKLDAALKQIEDFKQIRLKEQQVIESLVSQRDHYKSIAENLPPKEELQGRREYTVQVDNAQKLADHQILLENNRLKLQLSFLEERIIELKDNCLFYKQESDSLRMKYNELSIKLIEQQSSMNQNFNELVDLKNSLLKLEAKIFQLTHENQYLNELRQNALKDCDNLKEEIRRQTILIAQANYLQNEIKANESDSLKRFKDKFENSEAEILNLTNILSDKNAEIEKLRQANLNFLAMKAEWQQSKESESKAQNAESQSLKIEKSESIELEAKSEEIISVEAAVDQKLLENSQIIIHNLQSELARSTKLIAEQEDALNLSNTRIQQLIAECNQFQYERNNAQVNLEAFQVESQQNKANLDILSEELSAIKEKMKHLKAQLDEEIISHGKDLEEMNSFKSKLGNLESLEKVVVQLKNEIALKNTELGLEQSKSKEYKARIERIEQQMDSMLNQRAVSTNSDDLFSFLKAEKDTLLIENTSLNSELKRIKFQLEQQNSIKSELEFKIQNYENHDVNQKKLLEKVQEMSILRESNTLLRMESEEKIKRISSLESELANLKLQLNSFNSDKLAVLAEKETLSQEKEFLLKQVDELKNELGKLKTKMNLQMSQEALKLKEDNARLIEESQKLAQDNSRLSELYSKLSENNSKLVEDNAKLAEEKAQETERLVNEISRLTEILENSNQETAKVRERVKLLEDKLRSLIDKFKNSEQKNKQLDLENTEIKRQLAEAAAASQESNLSDEKIKDQEVMAVRIHELEQKLTLGDEKIAELEHKLAVSDKQKLGEEFGHEKLQEMEQKLAASDEKVQKLAKACQVYKGKNESLSSQFKEEKLLLENNIQLLEEQVRKLKEDSGANAEAFVSKNEDALVGEELSRLQSENQELTKKIDKLLAAIQKFQQMKVTFLSMKEDLKTKDAELESRNAAIQKLESDLAEFKVKFDNQKKEFDLHKAALASQFNAKMARMLKPKEQEEIKAEGSIKRDSPLLVEEAKKSKHEEGELAESKPFPISAFVRGQRGSVAARGSRAGFVNRKLKRGQ